MTSCIKNIIFVPLLILMFAGCASSPDLPENKPDENSKNNDQPVIIKADTELASDTDEASAKPNNVIDAPDITPFITNLPDDPYYQQDYPDIPLVYRQQLKKAIELFQQGALESSREILSALIRDEREISSPYLYLALISKQQGEKEKAIEYASKAVALNPYNYDAHNLLGIIAREDGRFVDAEQHYLDILDLWQGYENAHLNLGILYDLYLGQFDKALDHYQKHLLLVEENPRVAGWIADIKRRLNDA